MITGSKSTGGSLSHTTGREPMGWVSIGLALMTVILWGGTAVVVRVAEDVYPPLFIGGVRFAMATGFMIAWCRIEGTPIWLKGQQWWLSLLVGFLMFVQIATFNYGTVVSNSSHAIVLVNSFIFWIAFYEGFVRRVVRFHWWQILGLFLAGSAVVLMVGSASGEDASRLHKPSLFGDVILALSGFTLAVKLIAVKHAVKTVPPSALILWHDFFGSGLLFLLSFAVETHSGKPLTIEVLIALLVGGIAISGVCFVVNAMLLKKHGASQVSVYSFLTPLCGILLSVLFFGDHLSKWLLISGVFVAGGIFLVNWNPKNDR